MFVMAPGRAALVAIPMLLGACIPGVLTVAATDGGTGSDGPTKGEDGGPGDAGTDGASSKDASGDQTTGGDSGTDAPAQPDAGDAASLPDTSDAASLPDGYIQCAATSVQCNAAGGDQCCLDVFGIIEADGSSDYTNTSASCEAVGGPNCGAYLGTGSDFDEQLPQTCSTQADCAAGAACCVAFTDAGAVRIGEGITCQPTCNAPDRSICRDNGDCTTGTCQPETDPILMHLYARYCQ
jgi:hypothetical protein